MSLIRLYIRVLRMLGTESRLGWTLAIANLGLAAAQFADPVLFGRIIDTLVNAEKRAGTPTWAQLTPLLLAWIGFAL
ncbi:MAG: glucan ABC transporter ATP-binding protein/ permease, partial [Deltaproteobacteria bacterium]